MARTLEESREEYEFVSRVIVSFNERMEETEGRRRLTYANCSRWTGEVDGYVVVAEMCSRPAYLTYMAFAKWEDSVPLFRADLSLSLGEESLASLMWEMLACLP